MVLLPPKGQTLHYANILTFWATNNEVKYEPVITGLHLVRGVNINSLKVKCDSELIVSQIKGEYKVKEKK